MTPCPLKLKLKTLWIRGNLDRESEPTYLFLIDSNKADKIKNLKYIPIVKFNYFSICSTNIDIIVI